ncbi:Netrin receptor UNC5B-b [Schistosoma japonicum]|uniref:Netrin receptor UNC5 n=2 Tax=Schistosoma japonicum TaxID=6182 RepID=A0A4Z2D1A1_SCHJA|nr:Netrin receptor UNC5B-b [Schistosoma japonicum]
MLQRFLLTIAKVFLALSYPFPADSQEDLVQPDETHLEGVPSFIEHPKPLYYTTKNKPATIECVAEPVSHAAIKCAEQTIPYKGPGESGTLEIQRLNSDNLPDPEGKRWKLRLEVRARDVEEWFDTYVCHCEAWNKVVKLQRPKKVISNATEVKEAYLEEKFQLEPVSTDLAVSKRLMLTCLPPEGDPDPEVYWLKDGKRVDAKSFPHIIINDYNHLIIENTTTSDSGNYTCVAACLNGEKRRAVARVNIFPYNSATNRLAGDELKSWGEWGACNKLTIEGNSAKTICQQTRYRICANQIISKTELKSHDVNYPVTDQCPLPLFQTRNCSSSQCVSSLNKAILKGIHLSDMKLPTSTSEVSSSQMFRTREIAIYVGLFLSLAVLLAIIAIVALITRRKSLKFSTARAIHYSTCLHGKRSCRQEKTNKKSQDLLLPGDLTQTMITIINPSVADSQGQQKMNRLNPSYNANNINGKTIGPNVINGAVGGIQFQHQYNSTVGQGLVFSNGASLGTPLLANLPPPPAPPPPPPTPPPPLPGSLPLIPATTVSFDGSNETSDISGYVGFPSTLPSTQHFMNSASCQVNGYLTTAPYIQTNVGFNNQVVNSLAEPTYVESEVGQRRITCLSNFPTPVVVNNSGGPIESSSGPSPANTGTTVTAIGSCNGGSSNGSVGLPINGCLTNRSPNNYNMNFLRVEIDDYNDKCEPHSGLYHELSLDGGSSNRSLLCEFKDPLDLDTVVRSTISSNGDQLALAESGVFLTIPQGALQSNSLVEVYLAICREDKHRPTLNDHQTLLSPVIQFGPVDLHLSKPVLLSFPHCAELSQSSWLIRVLALGPNQSRPPNNLNISNTNGYKSKYNGLLSNIDNFIWQEVGIIGYESSDTNLICHLDSNMAHLMTDVAQRYCLIGETQKFQGFNCFISNHRSLNNTDFQNLPSDINATCLERLKLNNFGNNNNSLIDSIQDSKFLPDLQLATKILKLAAFAGPVTPTIDYNIRVYVLTDTKDALEHVFCVEKRLEGRLLDCPKPLLFRDNGGGLCFCIEDISAGWRSRLQTKSQEIPFRHIWNGTQMSTLHCAFSLEHLDPRQLSVSCKIKVHQENTQLQGQILNISSQKFELKTGHSRTRFPSSEDDNPDFRYLATSYKLPVVTTQRLCKLLDSKESEWQKFAKHIGMERYISYLKSQLSPTAVLLNIWETRSRDEPGVNDLKTIFCAMDRTDCANLLDIETNIQNCHL